jgi:hypothetical protein
MSQADIISIRRSVAIRLGVAVVLVAAFGCSLLLFDDVHSPERENIVRVSIKSDKLPPGPIGIERLPKGITAIIFVSQGTAEAEGPILTAVTPQGEPMILCGSPSEPECTLVTSPRALALAVSGDSSTGRCLVGTYYRSCHKAGPYMNKWYWHADPDNRIHKDCPAGCQ